jgi:hypothetical protein
LSTPGSASNAGNSDVHSAWGGVHVNTARSQSKTWYGPSSLFYFIGRFAAFLDADLLQTNPAGHMLDLNQPSMLLDGPTKGSDESGTVTKTVRSEFLSLSQEEYFLDHYWQAYHTGLFPILDEADFKDYYRSLWAKDGSQRAPSALVDIILALCVQYALSKEKPATSQQPDGPVDATVAGNMYYRRCQRLLAYESESPTISTVQCHVLCCIYLCCGTYQNMADSACGQALRAAYMLGLHLEPPQAMALREREQRKRLWWALYILDSKIGMKLGRPFLAQPSQSWPSLPRDDFEAAMQSGSSFAPLGDDVTWLSFNLYQAKLFRVTREIHTAFYGKDVDMETYNGQTIWDDPTALESHAIFMRTLAVGLEQWKREVPTALTATGDADKHAFVIDGAVPFVEPFAPLWIQRQRLLLELMYHNLCTNLYRPFISFTGKDASSPAVGEAADKCALHAAQLTIITHHVLSSTTILAGWMEVFQWQWNAAMTLFGFVFAHPGRQCSERAKAAINLAVAVFDILSQSFAVASSASKIVRELAAKAELVAYESRQSSGQTVLKTKSSFLENGPQYNDAFVGNDLAAMGVMGEPVDFGGLLQLACDVEQWTDLDMLWPSTGDAYMETWLMT